MDDSNLNEAVSSVSNQDTVVKDPGADCDSAISSTTPDKFAESTSNIIDNLLTVEGSSLNADADFFGGELNISNVPSEKISENVEDIVQDLENLLGESSDSYNFNRDSYAGTSKLDSCNEINSSNVDDLMDDSSLYLEEAKLHEVLTNSASFAITSEEKLLTREVNRNKTEKIETSISNESTIAVNEGIEISPSELVNAQQENKVESSYINENVESLLTEERNENENVGEMIISQVESGSNIELNRNVEDEVLPESNLLPESSVKLDNFVEEINQNVQESHQEVREIVIPSVSETAMDVDLEPKESLELTTVEEPCTSNLIDSSDQQDVNLVFEADSEKVMSMDCDESASEFIVSSSNAQKQPTEEFEGLSSTTECDIKLADSIVEENLNISTENTTISIENQSENLANQTTELSQPLTVEVEDSDFNKKLYKKEEETTTPKAIVDPKPDCDSKSELTDNIETSRAPLIMTIAKHKTNNTHSILKIYDPNEAESGHEQQQVPKLIIKASSSSAEPIEEPVIPKITIKPIPTRSEHSPKVSSKSGKQLESLEKSVKSSGSASPRTSKKNLIKVETPLSPLKLTIKPYPKLEERLNSPKLNIKLTSKPQEEILHTESHHSPKITIKPIIKPDDQEENTVPPFKLNIKPIVKPADSLSPKITIKPIIKPPEPEISSVELIDFEDQIKQERIVLKLPKTSNKKEKVSPSADLEKLNKIKLKLSREDGLAHIVPVSQGVKRLFDEESEQPHKYFKSDTSDLTVSLVSNPVVPSTSISNLTVSRVDGESSPGNQSKSDISITPAGDSKPVETIKSEDFSDPLADIPVFEITLQNAASMVPNIPAPVIPPAPRKRGRPRKVPLVVREEFKDPKDLESTPAVTPTTVPVVSEESSRPKRSCRGPSVRATLGIKPRKPRGSSTRGGRGGKRNVCNRLLTKKGKERKPYGSNKKKFADFAVNSEFKLVPLPGELPNRDVALYEEETRMSAENSSRAHTPAKQVFGLTSEVVEESQSSIQSNTTTESGEKIQKVKRGSRLEVHQEPEGEVISADKLAEYSWGGGGPYMLQEQVAQFLGIKSFKRKYPGIHRRPVDMQERDFIRESCLASEAMCDMGLTAVKSEDILDIMYTDFQNKYEEYCKHQRDRQAKEVSNKQKALSQEKNKMNIVERAIQSAYKWNALFNKKRREERKACFDLQTFTIHFPKGKMKQINKPPIGHYPVTLVPGQFTDDYKVYTPEEIGRFPFNTVSQKKISYGNQDTEESQSDDSGSDSDSSSSDSDSSCSGSSDGDNCANASYSGKKVSVR